MIQNAQALRAVAASMVVIHHIGSLYLTRELGIVWPTTGAAGVDLFFVLSGFIMVYSTINGDQRPVPFICRRIIRIVPLYALVTLVVWAMINLGFQVNGLIRGVDGTVEQLLKSLFFVPFERAWGDIVPLLTVGWTLNYEMLFYALLALSLSLRHWGNPFHTLLIILFALVGVGAFLGDGAPLALRFFLDAILLEFAIGMVIGLAYRHITAIDASRSKRLGAMVVVIGVGALAMTAVLGIDGEVGGIVRVIVWGLPAAAIITGALMLERAGVLWNNPFLLLQGDASYATYLVHMLVMQTSVWIIAIVLAPTSTALIVLIAGGLFVACLTAGTVLHLLVERPVTRLLRRDFLITPRPMPFAR
ncbi:MAG: acyltransferase [Pseudomonadota bacterium]